MAPPRGPHAARRFSRQRRGSVIWTKPGAHYVCIEPWHGIADPEGFTGDFRDKPGVFEVPAGESMAVRMSVTLVA